MFLTGFLDQGPELFLMIAPAVDSCEVIQVQGLFPGLAVMAEEEEAEKCQEGHHKPQLQADGGEEAAEILVGVVRPYNPQDFSLLPVDGGKGAEELPPAWDLLQSGCHGDPLFKGFLLPLSQNLRRAGRGVAHFSGIFPIQDIYCPLRGLFQGIQESCLGFFLQFPEDFLKPCQLPLLLRGKASRQGPAQAGIAFSVLLQNPGGSHSQVPGAVSQLLLLQAPDIPIKKEAEKGEKKEAAEEQDQIFPIHLSSLLPGHRVSHVLSPRSLASAGHDQQGFPKG